MEAVTFGGLEDLAYRFSESMPNIKLVFPLRQDRGSTAEQPSQCHRKMPTDSHNFSFESKNKTKKNRPTEHKRKRKRNRRMKVKKHTLKYYQSVISLTNRASGDRSWTADSS